MIFVITNNVAIQMTGQVNNRTFLQLIKASALIDQRTKKLLKPEGITQSQFHILRILTENNPLPCQPKDIKENLIISSPDVTRILDRMVKKGWIDRQTSVSNRRQVDVFINEVGSNLYEKINKVLQSDIEIYLSEKMTQEEVNQLIHIANKIT